jgi:toxin ParE1/3/4
VDYKIRLSGEAIENLVEITARIALDSPDRAKAFGNKLLDRLEILRRFPEIGSVYTLEPPRRKLVSSPYLIVYRLDQKAKMVEIITFLHAGRLRRS